MSGKTSLSKSKQAAIFAAGGFILICCLCILAIALTRSGKTSTPDPSSKLIVPAGKLVEYQAVYSNYDEVFVTKKDGSLDERPNDLEELCLDWQYFQNKIIEYTVSGETDKAAEARTTWKNINSWLSTYNEDDVGTMFSIIEKRKK